MTNIIKISPVKLKIIKKLLFFQAQLDVKEDVVANVSLGLT